MRITLTADQVEALVDYAKASLADDPADLPVQPQVQDAVDALEDALKKSRRGGGLSLDELNLMVLILTDWVQTTYQAALAKGPADAKALQDGRNDWNTIRLSVLVKLQTWINRQEAQRRSQGDRGPMAGADHFERMD